MDEIVEIVTTESVETVAITSTEVGTQGPRGPQGEAGFTTGIDIISGGSPSTDYANEYQFDGGAP